MVGSIKIENVNKLFSNKQKEQVTALKDINLDIPSNSFISLIGPSGCGKSTLLRLIAGLIEPSSGKLELDGKQIVKPGYERGFMFQEHNLFPWLTIYDNVAFGLKARGIFNENKSSVDEYLELVGLKGFEKYYPHQLSGGMCQRASLARALVGHPSVLLLDEPLGALDAFTRMNIQDEDKIVVMTPRPGRITSVVDVNLPRPRDRSDYDFLKYHGEILKLLKFGGFKQQPEYNI